MDTPYSRRNTNTTAMNTATTNSFRSPFPSTSPHHHHGNAGGGTFAAFSGMAHPRPPYTSPTSTYSSLPSPRLMRYGIPDSSNPPLLPLPISRSTSLPTPSPPLPAARRSSGRACRVEQRRPKPVANPKPRKGCQQANQGLTKASLHGLLEDHEPVESPPPSSLPLPRFSLRAKASPGAPPTCNVEAMDGRGGNDDVGDLLRLLRLK